MLLRVLLLRHLLLVVLLGVLLLLVVLLLLLVRPAAGLRRETRLDTAVAVPAITAVRATPRISPMIIPPFRGRVGYAPASATASSSCTGIRPLATICAPPRRQARASGAAQTFS
ncbi:hypothetical protein ACFQY4_24035 [Catellatospora bangladeshensis]|uniref:hypothetical protein n=1 Tax=Catellatospora bangladeshensis TaxID=310355 RepID=UPI00360965C4